MRVRATAWGYYGNMGRNPGEVFTLKAFKTFRKVEKVNGKSVVSKSDKPIQISAEEQFCDDWMEKVDDKTPVRKADKIKKRSDAYPPEDEPVARAAHQPRDRDERNEQEPLEDADGDARNSDESVI